MNTEPRGLHDYIIDAAARLPEKVAIVARSERWTYGDVEARSNALANALVAGGVVRGDRVVVLCDNGPEAIVAFWGVLKANAVVSLMNPQTKPAKLAYVLRDSGATALVTEGHLLPAVAEATAECPSLRLVVMTGKFDPARLPSVGSVVSWREAVDEGNGKAAPRRQSIDVDLASIIYTSGSTGDPKGVMLTHRNMLAAATSISTYLGTVQDDVLLGVLPLSFDYGLYQAIMATKAGATIVVEKSFAYPAEVLTKVVEEQVTAFPGVPTMFAVMADMKSIDRYDLSRVRYVTNTAAALPVKHILRLKDIFPKARIFSMYGLTECKRCSYLPPEDLDRKPTSVGVAIPNTELWLVDDDDQRVGPGKVGQLVIRGATVMAGYWGKPEATAKKLRAGPLPGERVLYTGDYCTLDEEGYLYFVGRMDDIIKCRGEKVAPKEIEAVLYGVPGVKEAAVIGVDDPILGQAPKAFVALEEGATVDVADLKRECQARLEPFMVPKYFELLSVLPKSANGKIDKRALA
jgi:amino acid adenylation domain-containing protein